MADVEGAITCAFMPPSSGHTRVAPWRKPSLLSVVASPLRFEQCTRQSSPYGAVGGKKHLLVPAYTKTKQLARRRGWVGMSGVHTGSACKCLRAENESSDDLCVYCVYCVSTACLLRVYCVSTLRVYCVSIACRNGSCIQGHTAFLHKEHKRIAHHGIYPQCTHKRVPKKLQIKLQKLYRHVADHNSRR